VSAAVATRARGGRPSFPEGTRRVDNDGRARVRRGGRWVREDRLAVEALLGRELRQGESVRRGPDGVELWVRVVVAASEAASPPGGPEGFSQRDKPRRVSPPLPDCPRCALATLRRRVRQARWNAKKRTARTT